jgi:hypothetical protein
MGTHTKIDEGAAFIDGCFRPVGDLVPNEVYLERIRAKELESLILRQNQSLERELLAANFLRFRRNRGQIIVTYDVAPHVRIIVKSRLG